MEHEHLAALVRAVARLRPAGPLDPALVTALAELMREAPSAVDRRRRGQLAQPAQRARQPGAATQTEEPLPAGTAQAPPSRPDDAQGGRSAPRRGAHDPSKLVALESSLVQVAQRADLAAPRSGASLADAAAARAATELPGPAAPVESLFPPGRVRAILREMATLAAPSGQLDLAAAVAMIARAEPIKAMPQRMLRSLGHSVQLLFDAGPAMLPFARDKQQLAATATRLIGKDRVRVGDFIVDPLQGVRPQRQVRWEPLHWPGRRSVVVVVSDLGIGGVEDNEETGHEVWQRFLDGARRRGLRCVVLIPYAQERWPAAATRFGTGLSWDLGTGVQMLRRSMRSGGPD